LRQLTTSAHANGKSHGYLELMTDTLLIVEDDPAMRDAWHDTLRDSFHQVVEAASLRQAKAQFDFYQPAVALVDLGLPDGDGCDFIRYALAKQSNFIALVSTVFGDEAHVVRAVQAGARGYVLKDATLQAVKQALADARAGGVPLSPQVARYLIKTMATTELPMAAAQAAEVPRLSGREREVLELIAKGCSATEAASVLGVATSTVVAHTKSLYGKLEVHSRSEAVFEARHLGLLR
jgi:DNA-binding NarL/FixJ family response regulator